MRSLKGILLFAIACWTTVSVASASDQMLKALDPLALSEQRPAIEKLQRAYYEKLKPELEQLRSQYQDSKSNQQPAMDKLSADHHVEIQSITKEREKVSAEQVRTLLKLDSEINEANQRNLSLQRNRSSRDMAFALIYEMGFGSVVSTSKYLVLLGLFLSILYIFWLAKIDKKKWAIIFGGGKIQAAINKFKKTNTIALLIVSLATSMLLPAQASALSLQDIKFYFLGTPIEKAYVTCKYPSAENDIGLQNAGEYPLYRTFALNSFEHSYNEAVLSYSLGKLPSPELIGRCLNLLKFDLISNSLGETAKQNLMPSLKNKVDRLFAFMLAMNAKLYNVQLDRFLEQVPIGLAELEMLEILIEKTRRMGNFDTLRPSIENYLKGAVVTSPSFPIQVKVASTYLGINESIGIQLAKRMGYNILPKLLNNQSLELAYNKMLKRIGPEVIMSNVYSSNSMQQHFKDINIDAKCLTDNIYYFGSLWQELGEQAVAALPEELFLPQGTIEKQKQVISLMYKVRPKKRSFLFDKMLQSTLHEYGFLEYSDFIDLTPIFGHTKTTANLALLQSAFTDEGIPIDGLKKATLESAIQSIADRDVQETDLATLSQKQRKILLANLINLAWLNFKSDSKIEIPYTILYDIGNKLGISRRNIEDQSLKIISWQNLEDSSTKMFARALLDSAEIYPKEFMYVLRVIHNMSPALLGEADFKNNIISVGNLTYMVAPDERSLFDRLNWRYYLLKYLIFAPTPDIEAIQSLLGKLSNMYIDQRLLHEELPAENLVNFALILSCQVKAGIVQKEIAEKILTRVMKDRIANLQATVMKELQVRNNAVSQEILELSNALKNPDNVIKLAKKKLDEKLDAIKNESEIQKTAFARNKSEKQARLEAINGRISEVKWGNFWEGVSQTFWWVVVGLIGCYLIFGFFASLSYSVPVLFTFNQNRLYLFVMAFFESFGKFLLPTVLFTLAGFVIIFVVQGIFKLTPGNCPNTHDLFKQFVKESKAS